MQKSWKEEEKNYKVQEILKPAKNAENLRKCGKQSKKVRKNLEI